MKECRLIEVTSNSEKQIRQELRLDSNSRMRSAQVLSNPGNSTPVLFESMNEYRVIEVTSTPEKQIRQESKLDNSFRMRSTQVLSNPRNRMPKSFRLMKELTYFLEKTRQLRRQQPD
jgi:hypothetical protein